MPLGHTFPGIKKYIHYTGVPPYTDSFPGTAGDLTAPWLQGRDLIANPTFGLQRDGSGLVKAGVGSGNDVAACYNNDITADHYSQVVSNFNGPADGSSYIYLFVRCNNHSGWYEAALGKPFYRFHSDGGSDTAVMYFDSSNVSHVLISDPTFVFVANDTLRFQIIGTELRLYKNSVERAGCRVTDTNVATGFPGIGLSVASTLNKIKSFQAGAANVAIHDELDWKRKYDNSSIVSNYTPDIVALK